MTIHKRENTKGSKIHKRYPKTRSKQIKITLRYYFSLPQIAKIWKHSTGEAMEEEALSQGTGGSILQQTLLSYYLPESKLAIFIKITNAYTL